MRISPKREIKPKRQSVSMSETEMCQLQRKPMAQFVLFYVCNADINNTTFKHGSFWYVHIISKCINNLPGGSTSYSVGNRR